MDSLSGIQAFVQVAETRSFSAAGRLSGVSSSAMGKSVARMEQRLGVRLFHRSTRSITLTAEGAQFLERCRRILAEIAAAELELADSRAAPRGKLRISLPLVSGLMLPVLMDFMHHYPDIALDVDFTDRLVDIVEEGFDAVVRTGEPADSRLMSRRLGRFRLMLVAAPDYLLRRGLPQTPQDLLHHACLQHKFPSSGRFEPWPLRHLPDEAPLELPATMICNTTEALVQVALAGLGIACLPDFMVREPLRRGALQQVLAQHTEHQGAFRIVWPSSKYLAPKLRVFIDFLSERLFPTEGA
ncbi:LysR family transcriptional regulator [Serratia entomophila]|uniref:LysR family transcriptional regulator n=1 Tax=Serratia entomophila TaxID=42906 RepID=UPI00217C652F|nr:LysR family transcriptional regulator [Serratia entomophila]CAI0725002.1 D-malate degradation protein R [Serratia entomophila]CAI0854001.1 D-malate degradation protein R [Serratia entomophila]CAI1571365.1 D-malate degradation protein R [Serratia entomophila]CAI1668989.1 D-malate degradation protein R [Serratia entomophila]CAI1684856.1 D-malate degradation protein R [Serratia entomophila]